MPKIPTYERSGNLPVTYQDPRTASAGFEAAGQLGGQAANWATQRLAKQKAVDDARWISNTLASTRNDWTQRLLKAQQEAPAGAPDFSQTLLSQFDDATRGLAEQAPSQEARLLWEDRLPELRDKLASNAFAFEATEYGRHAKSEKMQQTQLGAATVRADPEQFDDVLIETLAGIGASNLSAADKDELTATARRDLATAQVNAFIDKDPDRAMADLVNGRWAGDLPSNESERLINNAGVAIRSREAEARGAAAEARQLDMMRFRFELDDDRARAQDGRPREISDARILDMMGEETGTREIADLNGTQRAATDVRSIALLPAAKQTAIIDSYAPGGANYAGEAGRHEGMRKIQAELQRQLAQDPAGYVYDYSPPLQQAFDAAAASGKPEDLQKAITLSLSTQEAIGVAPENRRALSEPLARQTAERIKAATGTAKADAMQGEAAAYGPYWRQAYGELVKAGLPADYQALATMPSAPGRKNLAQIADLPEADVKPRDAGTATEATEAADKALQTFDASLAGNPSRLKLMAVHGDAVRRLTWLYSRSMDTDEAAARAFDEVLGQRYDFVDDVGFDGGPARAPKGQGSAVAARAAQLLAGLTVDGVGDPGGYPELTAAQRRALYLPQVQAGYWLANEDESGWVRIDAAGEPALGFDGRPIVVPFDLPQTPFNPQRYVPSFR